MSPIIPPVKRKLVFSEAEEDIDQNLLPTPEMSRESFSSTPLVPSLWTLKPFIGIWLPKALQYPPPRTLVPNPNTGEDYPDVADTLSPYSGYTDVPDSQSPESQG
ncbi:hypothetical protein M0R45_017764 [Rubus argutus]|uniref:Uncharacterized protein n=1 Tax=Rubus argutus TaxID=59490 RepID=A0AAW1XX25_RUBAR